MSEKKTDAQWREILTPEQYEITRKHGTERPFSHRYNQEKSTGVYNCVCCNEPLFSSKTKYESGTGWPSFNAPLAEGSVSEHVDRSWFTTRTEVRCAKCEAHLGHVFPDGPQPSGLRYCLNGTALNFKKEDN